MRTIPLTKGYSALVDDQDYEAITIHKWRVCIQSDRTKYAIRTSSRKEGKRRTIAMHRELLRTDQHVDHKDGDGLNNRRDNLRRASKSQNGQNVPKYKGAGRFKGASWSTRDRRWISQIQCGTVVRHIGSFKREENAAQAYNFAAAELFGEFASFNQA